MKIAKLTSADLVEIKRIESKLGIVIVAYDDGKPLNCVHGHRHCVICKHDSYKGRWID